MTDWKGIAPKREDWERLTALFVASGLPRPTWINGTPVFPSPVDEERVLGIARGVIASPESPPSGEKTPVATEEVVVQNPPKKHAGGRPKGSKNKPKK